MRDIARKRGFGVSESRPFRPLSVGGGWLIDDQLFRFLVDFEIQKAQRLRYCVSLVCLAAEVASTEPHDPSTASLAEIVTRYIRGTDAVVPWAPGSLALLLIDAESIDLPPILRRLMARLGTIAWSAGGSCYPKTASRPDDLLRQAVDLMVRAKEEGGNRIYVGS